METGAGVPGPWCLIRDVLGKALYARNTGLDRPLADHGALCEGLGPKGPDYAINAMLVDRFRQMEPLMRPLAPGNVPFWPDSSV
jgi:hypothetical protein